MSSESPKKKVEVLRIWVPKHVMRAAFLKLSEDYKALISANITKSLPDDYEVFPADGVKDTLLSVGAEWRDTKLKPKVPITPAVSQ